MIQFIRNRSKFLLWAIVVIVVIFFSFWGTLGPDDIAGVRKVGRLAGQPVAWEQFRGRLNETELVLGLFSGMPMNMDMGRDFAIEQTWHRLMLLHEAQGMGMRVDPKEKGQLLASHPLFRAAEGGFDATRFDRFVKDTLPRYRVGEERFEDLLGEEILSRRTAALLTSGAHVPAAKVRQQAERLFSEATVWVAEFKAGEFTATAAPTEEEVRAAFDAQKERFQTPERRKVRFVRFALKDQDRKLPEEEKQKKFQALGEQAVNFSVSLYDADGNARKDFDSLALKSGLSVEKSDWFTQEGPATMENGDEFAKAAFLLNADAPNSDAIPGSNEVYVATLEAVEQPKARPLEAVRDEIVKELGQRKAIDAAFKAAGEARQKVEGSLKAGKAADEAMRELGARARKVEKVLPASDKEATGPEDEQLRSWVARMDTGELSQLRTQGDAVAFALLASRTPPADLDARLPIVRARMIEERRSLTMREWLAIFMRRPDTLLGGLQQGGEG